MTPTTLIDMPGAVLLLEDDDGIAAPLRRTLEREGYDVERLAHGAPAVDRVADGGVDLVILDRGLPDIDGLDVCRQLRTFDPRVAVPLDAGLRVDPRTRRVFVGDREVPLTSKEFDVLALLTEAPGEAVTRTRLMDLVWDENWHGSTKTLDVTVGRLRQKLDEAESLDRVVTVRGVGFRMGDRGTDA